MAKIYNLNGGDELSLIDKKRREKLTVAKMIFAIKLMHEVVSIFYFYDVDLLRPLRFVLVYQKILLVVSVAALFS